MDRIKVLETIVVIAGALMIIGLVLKSTLFFSLAFVFVIIGLFMRSLAVLVAKIWLGISELIGFYVSHIILAIIFFAILTPIAFLARIVRREDFLALKNNRKSFFVFEIIGTHRRI